MISTRCRSKKLTPGGSDHSIVDWRLRIHSNYSLLVRKRQGHRNLWINNNPISNLIYAIQRATMHRKWSNFLAVSFRILERFDNGMKNFEFRTLLAGHPEVMGGKGPLCYTHPDDTVVLYSDKPAQNSHESGVELMLPASARRPFLSWGPARFGFPVNREHLSSTVCVCVCIAGEAIASEHLGRDGPLYSTPPHSTNQ